MVQNKTPFQFTGLFQGKNVEVLKNGNPVVLDNYIPEPDLVQAVNLALLLEKPLLVMGEPGCGKSLLAKAIAYELYRENLFDLYREWHIKSTSKAREGLYEFDNISRLRDANLQRVMDPDSKMEEDIDQYISYGPMGDAFLRSTDPTRRVVLLIDEIDKADIDFPNDLLNELERMEFEIKEKKGEMIRAKSRPIVIVTSNSEKELPDAFLRRCLFHYIKPLKEDKLRRIVEGRYYADGSGKDNDFVGNALGLFLKLRNTTKSEVLSLSKNVSTGEFIDWFAALKHYQDLMISPEKSGLTSEEKELVRELDKLPLNDLMQIPFRGVLLKNINSMIRFNAQD